MNTRLTTGPTDVAETARDYPFLADALGRVSMSLQVSRSNLQELVEKIYGDSTYALPLPEERKRCMDTVLDFRLTISDLIESFWESSGQLASQCKQFQQRLETPENPKPAHDAATAHQALIRAILDMNHQSQVLLAQICVIQQAIGVCDNLFVSILERGTGARLELEGDAGRAIGELQAEIALRDHPAIYATRLAKVLGLRAAMSGASDDLLHQLAGCDFRTIPEAVRQFEATTQALYGGLSALATPEPGMQ